MKHRSLTAPILEALADTPVVLLAGARQTGKSTLARVLAAGPHPARYLTLDDATLLSAASRDPEGFVAGLESAIVIDEVQRVPDLLLAIKASVDRDRRAGRYLLTGSADVLAVPRVADTLAGRMEVFTLWPFSQGEIEERHEGLVDALFAGRPIDQPEQPVARTELWRRLVRGGYPEAVARARPDRREAWFRSYLDTILRREVRDLASIEGLAQLPQLLSLVAARSGSTLSYADLARTAQIPQSTLKRYLALLEATFLVHRLPAWSGNPTARLAKAPKLFVCDSGLACHLLGADEERLQRDGTLAGSLVEGFVAGELVRQAGWSRTRPTVHHLRSHSGREVDLVLEDRSGRVVGIEVKSGATVAGGDLAGLRALADFAGSRFIRGVVLYTGREVVPFATNLHAVPVSALWSQ
jgi:predicted AAA+ superfamily ATPase